MASVGRAIAPTACRDVLRLYVENPAYDAEPVHIEQSWRAILRLSLS